MSYVFRIESAKYGYRYIVTRKNKVPRNMILRTEGYKLDRILRDNEISEFVQYCIDNNISIGFTWE